jgi:bifunctional DNA-binding transcriptional regulator/antitoxin component of YhaV-PrlF toxin-antitoxin module
MAEVGRIIRISRCLYMAIPKGIAAQLCLKAGDRMAILTDGRTIAAAKIPLSEIVNRAFLRQTVELNGQKVEAERGTLKAEG